MREVAKRRSGAVRLAMVATALGIAAAACARLDTAPRDGSPSGAISHPTGPSDLVLRVGFSGGFLPPVARLTRLPMVSLYGDGTMITEGPQDDIYPSRALPSIQAVHLSEEGVQAILRAAADAGLLGPNARYTDVPVADDATTVFTVNAEGTTHSVEVYALGDEPAGVGGMSDEEAAARQALRDFRSRLGELTSWPEIGPVGEAQPLEPHGIRVFVQPGMPEEEQGLHQPSIDWPLAPGLSAFGEPITDPAVRMTCGVVEGDDLAPFLAEARKANLLTPWISDGQPFTLALRPLLPDESGCSSLDGA